MARPAALRRVFPDDSLTQLVVTVRRVVPADKPYVTTAPLPNTIRGTVVAVVLPDPKTEQDQEKARGDLPGARVRDAARGARVAVRARDRGDAQAGASQRGGRRVRGSARAGVGDGVDSVARVRFAARSVHDLAAWRVPTISSLSRPTSRWSRRSGARSKSRNAAPVAAERRAEQAVEAVPEEWAAVEWVVAGAAEADRAAVAVAALAEEGRVAKVMAATRGFKARRCSRRSRSSSGATSSRAAATTIAALADGQMLGNSVADILAIRKTVTLDHMDLDWLQWLLDRGAQIRR